MKVLLVGAYLGDCQESMLRFARIMQHALSEAEHDVRLIHPPAVAGRLRPSPYGLGKWLGYVDKFAIFPPTLRRAAGWADVVHICDHAFSHYVKYIRHRPHVVTCHDMIGVRTAFGATVVPSGRWSGRQLQRLILKGLSHSQHVACVSETTREQLLNIGDLPEHRVSTIYNGLNYPYSPMTDREVATRLRALGIPIRSSFLLHVGGNLWYKNRLGVLRIFSEIRRQKPASDLQLVMVGKPWTLEMRQFASRNSLNTCVRELTVVSDEDLRSLYSAAKLLLFPSLEEGFGWPIIEAQACGCPVVTTNRPPMNEIGGSAAIYIEPEDHVTAAIKIATALNDLSQLRSAGPVNARRFTTSSMIQSYVNLYSMVMRERSQSVPGNDSESQESQYPAQLNDEAALAESERL